MLCLRSFYSQERLRVQVFSLVVTHLLSCYRLFLQEGSAPKKIANGEGEEDSESDDDRYAQHICCQRRCFFPGFCVSDCSVETCLESFETHGWRLKHQLCV